MTAKELMGHEGYATHTEFPYAPVVRRYPQRTTVNIAIRMALFWPAEPATVPEYIKKQLGPQESALKQAVVDRAIAQIEDAWQTCWRRVWGGA